ncbi:type IV pilus assembly protein PilM [Herbaspirillum lusitanum]|uniref:type IV pilus assembly protein PilM n=1 Tax=Herbaspirillum lusitanum TaxID=213312 RepID=UPI00037A7C02|nr:type IV pilus assembly protein PilM [Herbaspirillum lusitanum]
MAGLDIGRSEVRMVEFSGSRIQTAQLACCTREALPDGAIGDEGIGNLRQVMEAVSRLWGKSGSQARQVAIAIPSSRALTQIVAIPAHSSQAQRAALAERHAESLLPYPPAQALLDFRIIGPTHNAPDQLDMLIAAVRRDDVEDRIAVAESLGLQTMVADIESHAAAAALNRTLPAAPASSVFAMANLETHGALLSLCCAGRVVGERQLDIGHRQLQHDLQQYDGDQSDVLAGYLAQAAAHLAGVLQTLQQQTSCVPSHIVLTGAGATISGMEEAVHKRTTISTAVATPFAGMVPAPAIDRAQIAMDGPACATACGLALRRFDR